MKNPKKLISSLLCVALVCLCSMTAFAADPSTKGVSGETPTENAKVNLMPIDQSGQLQLKPADEVPQLKNQAGEPFDRMCFYFIHLYPIVQDRVTGASGYLTAYRIGNTETIAPSIYVGYNVAKTTDMYKEINDKGYDILGWYTQVNFRFDFINPTTWTYSVDGGQSVTEGVPFPHNPYQTYTYSYPSYFKTDPFKSYNTTFKGKVNFEDKYDHQSKSRDFSASAYFNTSN